MEPSPPRRSPIVRFFSRSSNAFITAAATIMAAVISVYGVRQSAENKMSRIEQQLQTTRKQLQVTTAQLQTCQSGNVVPDVTTTDPRPDASTTLNDPYAGSPKASDVQQKFEIKLFGCRREGPVVKCYFSVTNTQAERSLEIAGYPGDNRYSRAYDDQGQIHTAEIPEISGNSGTQVSMPEGVTLRVSLTFKTVPSRVEKFSVLKLVFHYAYNSYSADFRDITIT